MAKTYSCILVGLEVVQVEIECFIGSGFTGLHILGLKADIARDMRERIRSALEAIGIPIPAKRVVVNLNSYELFRLARSPLQELDFAVAAAVIIALFQEQNLSFPHRGKEFFAGELTLTGHLRPLQNTLIYEKILNEEEFDGTFCVSHSLNQNLDHRFDQYPNLLTWLQERQNVKEKSKNVLNNENNNQYFSLNKQVLHKSILELKRIPKLCVAILIAAAGNHHLLLGGEPGIGKTYSIKNIIHYLKPLKSSESIEVQLIHSQKKQIFIRPFRSPHHSSSMAALIGGLTLKPGEVTLAHRGVLFLDEIAEFSRNVLEALREPLDNGYIDLVRSAGAIQYPAQFLLCATMNPCPCGYLFSYTKPCTCSVNIRKKYLNKMSGPLIDRFDLKLWIHKNINENDKSTDVFSSYLKDIDHQNLQKFVEHFCKIQNSSKIADHDFQIADQNTSDMNQPGDDFFKKNTENISLRGQNQIQRLETTFRKVFPMLIDDFNFKTDILSYRNFSKILENNLVN